LSAQGLVLAVVSANSLANVRAVLGEKNAACIQHYACGVSMSGKGARFKKILKTAQVLPSMALCIGDEIRDIEAARAAGIPCGAVGWGYTKPEALREQGPDMVFESIDEIIDRLT
jgi:phosphoglycolate phosphatase